MWLLQKKNSEASGEGGAGVVFDPSPYGIGLSKIDLFGDFACRDFACLYKIRNKKSREQHQQSNKALIYSFEARTLKKKKKQLLVKKGPEQTFCIFYQNV